MNELDGIRCVLSGAIDRVADDGVEWRNSVEAKCKKKKLNIIFFNPCKKPNGLGSEIGVEKNKVRKLINEDKWEDAKEYVKTFRHYDLRAIDWSDFVIIKIDITQHLCGSYDEIFLAERELKPIFVIMGEGQTKYDIPTWLVSFINKDEIFENEDECINYLMKINNGEILLDERWVKLS
jgi:hypothetical protein